MQLGPLRKLSIAFGLVLIVAGSAWLVSRVITERRHSTLEVDATAHQWWWEFDYPELGVKVANQLDIPKGRTVRLVLTSADVLHSFWVPSMKVNIDVVPGEKRTLFITSSKTGTLDGSCGAGCGCQTVCMRFRVLVSNESGFEKWIKKHRGVALEIPQNSVTPSCVLNQNQDKDQSTTAERRLAALLANGSDGARRLTSPSSAH